MKTATKYQQQFRIERSEADLLAKCYLDECRKCIREAIIWRGLELMKTHPDGYTQWLTWAKVSAVEARRWHAKLGIHFGKKGATGPWREDAAPMDGQLICVRGRVIFTEDVCTTSEPFQGMVRWTEKEGESKGWHYRSGLSVARTLEDKVFIDLWVEVQR